MIIGVKPTGLCICDTDRNELMFINYVHIASWGVNANIFVIVIQKTEYEIKKYYFEAVNVSKLLILLLLLIFFSYRLKCYNFS